jgi:hypothetical protein
MADTRRLVVLVLLAAVGLGVIGCGDREEEKGSPGEFSDAARKASHARTATLAISGSIERAGDPGRLRFSAEGTFDYSRRSGRFRLQPIRPTGGAGLSGSDVRGEVILTRHNVYVRSPAISRAFGLGSKRWRRIPLRRVGAGGVDFLPIAESINAVGSLRRLHATSGAERLGEERVGGIRTTRYRTTLKSRGPRGAAVPRTADIWVDDSDNVRRIEERFSYGNPNWVMRGTRRVELEKLSRRAAIQKPSTKDVSGPVSRTTAEALRTARRFRGYRLYFAGTRYRGLRLTAVRIFKASIGPPALPGKRPRPPSRVFSFIYGDCKPPTDPQTGLADGGCAPPLEIRNDAACARPPGPYSSPTTRLRGVPASLADEGATLYTGQTAVGIFATDAANVAAHLRSVDGGVRPKQRLQQPPPGALQGRLSCEK